MFKNKTSQSAFFNILFTCFFAVISLPSSADNISIQRMTKDVTHLASDKFKGRANFSKEIDLAANFISQRFSDIGLQKFKGLASFKQTFNVISITPNTVSVKINNQTPPIKNIAVASTMPFFSWNNLEKVRVDVINKNDNFRSKLRNANIEGGEHLILVDKVHEDIFTHYQGIFKNGLTKLKLTDKNTEHNGAIVLVLTDTKDVNQLDIRVTTQITQKTLSNVIAVLPGKSKKNEIVIFSAHYDHLGTTLNGKEIFNGADDNASGTSAVINLAEYFAKQNNNERTLLFAAFAAEEIGGYGSLYFSQKVIAESVIAMLNIEMIGKPSKFGVGTLWMTGSEHSNLSALLNKSLTTYHTKIYKDPYPEQGLFYRSDNATLARLGVPAHTFSSTQLDKDIHYHETSDDINSLHLSSMHKAIETLSVASKNLVNGTVTPSRVDISTIDAQGKIF